MTIFGSLPWGTIVIIFIATALTIIVQYFQKDRSLKLFNKFDVIIVRNNGSIFWGKIRVFKNCLELFYNTPYISTNKFIKKSYLMYPNDIDDICIIFRYNNNLNTKQISRKKYQVDKIIKRRFLTICWRLISNLFKRFKDAIRRAVVVVIGDTYKRKRTKDLSEQEIETKNASVSVVNIIGNLPWGKPHGF